MFENCFFFFFLWSLFMYMSREYYRVSAFDVTQNTPIVSFLDCTKDIYIYPKEDTVPPTHAFGL